MTDRHPNIQDRDNALLWSGAIVLIGILTALGLIVWALL